MKRPFILIGAACVGASFLLPIFGAVFSFFLLLAVAIIILCFVPKDRRIIKRIVLTLSILLLVGIRFIATEIYINHKNDRLINQEATVEAIITEVSLYENMSRFSLKITDSSENEAIGIDCDGYMYGRVDFQSGDKICATVKFKENDDRYKYSKFDQGKYINLQIKECYISEKAASPFYSFTNKIRHQTLRAVKSLGADKESSLLGAVIIGDQNFIETGLNNNVKATGTSHLLVVSGLHLGILCGILMRIFKSRLSRAATVLIMALFVILVAIICLFHISILRAGISYIIMLIGLLIFKDKDSLSSLGFATTVLTFCFPYIFYNVAFMLSAFATFAVIGPANTILETFSFYVKEKSLYKRALRTVFETVVVSVCALIFTLPITVYYFGSSALIAPISNLLLSFSVTGILASGMFGVMVWCLPIVGEIISVPLIFIARLFAKYFLLIVHLLSEINIGFINISPDKSFYLIILAAVFLIAVHFVCKFINSKKEIKPFAYRQDLKISP